MEADSDAAAFLVVSTSSPSASLPRKKIVFNLSTPPDSTDSSSSSILESDSGSRLPTLKEGGDVWTLEEPAVEDLKKSDRLEGSPDASLQVPSRKGSKVDDKKKLSKTRLKRFSHDQIKRRIGERSFVRGYAKLLMKSAVGSDLEGFTFNTKHPAWTKLQKIVRSKQTSASITASMMTKLDMELPKTGSPELKKDDTLDLSGLDMEDDESPDPSVWRRLLEVDEETPASEEPKDLVFIPEEDLVAKYDAMDTEEEELEAKSPPLSPRKGSVMSIDTIPDGLLPGMELYNQSVVRMDITRTRQDIEIFKEEATKASMEWVLCEFCKIEGVNYKQGLNYLLAPLLVPQLHIKKTVMRLKCLRKLVHILAPNVFVDDSFGSLQCLFKVFKLLLQFFDPKLSSFLEKNDMTPELYAAPFFLTLLGNRMEMSTLLFLWQKFLEHPQIPHDLEVDDVEEASAEKQDLRAAFHLMFWIALVLWNREELLSHDPLTLPENLNRLNLRSIDEAVVVLTRAQHLWRDTPNSVIELLQSVLKIPKLGVDSPFFDSIMSHSCIRISAKELREAARGSKGASEIGLEAAKSISSSSVNGGSKRVIILDCRRVKYYNAGHLPQSKNVDPETYQSEEKQLLLIQELQKSQGCLICLFSDGNLNAEDPNRFEIKLKDTLLLANLPMVCMCEGGYRDLHNILLKEQKLESELVDHDSKACPECIFRTMQIQRAGSTTKEAKSVAGRADNLASSLRVSKGSELGPFSTSSSFSDDPVIDLGGSRSAHMNIMMQLLRKNHSLTPHGLEMTKSRVTSAYSLLVDNIMSDIPELRENPESCLVIGLSFSSKPLEALRKVLAPLAPVLQSKIFRIECSSEMTEGFCQKSRRKSILTLKAERSCFCSTTFESKASLEDQAKVRLSTLLDEIVVESRGIKSVSIVVAEHSLDWITSTKVSEMLEELEKWRPPASMESMSSSEVRPALSSVSICSLAAGRICSWKLYIRHQSNLPRLRIVTGAIHHSGFGGLFPKLYC